MKLYTTETSPFGAGIKIQIYKKALPVKITPPPENWERGVLQEINPSGVTPVLEVDGIFIPESFVIHEYLEDRFPRDSLRGENSEQIAMQRLLAHLTDAYLSPAIIPIRGYVMGDHSDNAQLEKGIRETHKAFSLLEHFLQTDNLGISNRLSLSDCAMIPVFFYTMYFSQRLNLNLPLSHFKKLYKWYETIRTDTAVDKTLSEIEIALRPWEAANPKIIKRNLL